MYDSKIHHRRSIRIKDYDYSQVGMYFITVCTKDRKNILGKIIESKSELSNLGRIVENELKRAEEIYNYIKIYDYIIMPNHMHAIIFINDEYEEKQSLRAQSCAPTQKHKTIGEIIRGIKSSVSSKTGRTAWQRNYYEHVVRNEKELYRIQEYIQNNPINWENDENNLERISTKNVGAHDCAPYKQNK